VGDVMTPKFGTDGVRGAAFSELTTDYVERLGLVAIRVLGVSQVAVGRDTRESSPTFSESFARGAAQGGAMVVDLGVAPTPAIAFVSQRLGCAGASITASHNPYQDNGVKIFGVGGTKLSDDTERAIEDGIAAVVPGATMASTDVSQRDELLLAYQDHVCAAVEPMALAGMKIVVDCAHGAMSEVAPLVVARLGATVIVINDEPNGRNINDSCGATHPEVVGEAVRLHGATLGLAFDGDGDRVIAVDHQGEVVDGDHLLALAALDARERGELEGGVVVTVMTNAGFHRAMKEAGIEVVTTPVGDRNVLAAMEEHGFRLGGEQSGHIIHARHATTGDGLLAGVVLSAMVRRKSATLRELARSAMTSLPQSLVNVRLSARVEDPMNQMHDDVENATRKIGASGRVLLRASGTEPMIRVMVEAETQSLADEVAQSLAQIVAERFGSVR
jgi:phosphoglucosamine mutase